MPRRHNRGDHQPEPLSITPASIPKPTTRRRERTVGRRQYTDSQIQAAIRQRVTAAITNWNICMVPGCGMGLVVLESQRDVDQRLPICTYHAVIVKRQIDPVWNDEPVRNDRYKVQLHRDQVRDGLNRTLDIADAANADNGWIYFLRLNGLIKVGWSSQLTNRLKAYGPDVAVLCHYPATRTDETLLHRQLRPYLAKGREWYEDCKLIEDMVTSLIAQHGEPHMAAFWTKPKPEPIKRHRSSA